MNYDTKIHFFIGTAKEKMRLFGKNAFPHPFTTIRYPTRHAHRHEEIGQPPTLLGILNNDRELGEPFHRQSIDTDNGERDEFEGKEMPCENRQGMLAHEVQHLGTDALRILYPFEERVECPGGKSRRDDIWQESLVAIRILVHRHVPNKRTDERHSQCQRYLPAIERLHLIFFQTMTDDY